MQATQSSFRLTAKPLSGTLGAEVTNVDLAGSLDDPLVAAIKQAFHAHLVLVFRGQGLTPADQLAFTRLFGPVEPHPLASRRGVDGLPEVLVFENKKGTPGARNDFWHSDISFAEKPPACSVLYARTITEGCGDTMFCNMYHAYDELSEGMRRMLDDLTAMHTSAPLAQRNRAGVSDGQPIADIPSPVEHPVVRTHPETARKALYVNPYFTSHFAAMTARERLPPPLARRRPSAVGQPLRDALRRLRLRRHQAAPYESHHRGRRSANVSSRFGPLRVVPTTALVAGARRRFRPRS